MHRKNMDAIKNLTPGESGAPGRHTQSSTHNNHQSMHRQKNDSQGAVGPALSTWRHHIYADVDRARPTTTTRRQARRSSREQTIINPCIDNKINRQQSSIHASTQKRLMKRYLNKRHKTMARTSTLHTPRGRDRIATVPVLRQMKTYK